MEAITKWNNTLRYLMLQEFYFISLNNEWSFSCQKTNETRSFLW
jgi:hypothetical protein